MSVKHIFEALIDTNLFPGFEPGDGKAYGVLAEAKQGIKSPIIDIDLLWSKSESPIEKAMAAALAYAEWLAPTRIVAQFPLDKYRLDFLVTSGASRINVECDGKEFHYHGITMDRYQADRRRDHYVRNIAGISVLRFTGEEIWDNAIGCAHEVTELMRDLLSGK